MYEQGYRKAITEADRIRSSATGRTDTTNINSFFKRKSEGLDTGLVAGSRSSSQEDDVKVDYEDANAIVAQYLAQLRDISDTAEVPAYTGDPGRALAALRQLESSNRYDAVGPEVKKGMYKGQRAYGAYQVMEGNIPVWTRQVLGRAYTTEEFVKDKAAQDKVAFAKMTASYKKFGNWDDAAAVWFSGGPLGKDSATRNDGNTTVLNYVKKFRGFYDRSR